MSKRALDRTPAQLAEYPSKQLLLQNQDAWGRRRQGEGNCMKTWHVLVGLVIVGVSILGWRLQPGLPHAAASSGPIPASVQNDRVSPVTIGNTRYYFDVSKHGAEEINALLNRAAQMASQAGTKREEVDIAMVLHGPDIRIFAKENYSRYKSIVDLAARLDADNVIDFKACASSATQRGFGEFAFPTFIEMVPYAPDEIKRLTSDGYVQL